MLAVQGARARSLACSSRMSKAAEDAPTYRLGYPSVELRLDYAWETYFSDDELPATRRKRSETTLDSRSSTTDEWPFSRHFSRRHSNAGRNATIFYKRIRKHASSFSWETARRGKCCRMDLSRTLQIIPSVCNKAAS